LSPEVAELHHALQQRRRCEAGLAVFLEHDLGDAVERVDADEVAEGERPHRVAGAEGHAAVDVFDRAEAALEPADRVQHVRDEEPVDDEAGRVARLDRLLAERLRERERGAERLVAGRDGAHDLDQLHDGHGIEEVEADDAVGALRRGGHRRDGERAGVAGEDGLGRADAVQLAKHRVLGLEVLGDGLDDEVGVTEVCERRGGTDPVEGLIAQGGVELALLDGAIEAARDGLEAALAELVAHLADPRAIPRPGRDLRDPAPHQAAAQDGHCLYLRHRSSVETDPGLDAGICGVPAALSTGGAACGSAQRAQRRRCADAGAPRRRRHGAGGGSRRSPRSSRSSRPSTSRRAASSLRRKLLPTAATTLAAPPVTPAIPASAPAATAAVWPMISTRPNPTPAAAMPPSASPQMPAPTSPSTATSRRRLPRSMSMRTWVRPSSSGRTASTTWRLRARYQLRAGRDRKSTRLNSS